MERRNYFEMLGLDFDPPEKNDRKIQQAIAAWKKRTEDMLANETIATRRSVLSDELDLHDNIVEILKDNKSRNAEARELKEQRIAQLEKLIDIMLIGQSGTPEVTNAQIRNVHLKLKLSPKTIEDTYVKKGFVVQKREKAINLNEAFLTTVVSGNISSKVEQLRAMSIPKYPWTPKVFDLFDLACYFSGGSETEATSFRRKRTTELYSIMETGAAQLASDMSTQGHLLADLFTAGTTQVFDSETNRKKYEQSLEREKLKGFFALLKSAPDDFKKDRYFAERCIKTIQKSFPDFNLSLALYNQEAGLMQDPYEPIEALIHVTCRSCKNPMEFRTHEEAEKGKCTVCGAELYVMCPNPKCHKKVPASADWCSCGFHISEMQFFDEYFNAAQFALKEMDLAEARKQLANAQNAYPGHPKLSALQKQIQEENDKYQKPLNDLQSLIEAGNFYNAQKLLATISASMPQLKLEGQRKIIAEKLSEAQRMMPTSNLPVSARANRCVEILDNVKDYQPAIDMLGLCRPNAPINLHGAISSGEPLVCTLTWNSAGDKGVSYCVVRKKNGTPQRHSDGDMLIQSLNVLEYKDKSIQPGISYGYAVFAHRHGIYSDPITCEVEKFSELDVKRVRVVADNGVCRFSWVLPTNCIGVRILRCVNATPSEYPSANCTIVTERASANYDDTSVSNNETYGYRLQCVYPYGNGFRYSEGYTVMLTPEQPPVALRNITSKTEGRTVYVRWTSPDTAQRSVLVREVTSSSISNMIGQIIPATDINSILGNGKTYANTTSSAQQCQFDIPPNTSIALAVVIISGAKGIISEVIRASSVEKCEINKAETRIEGGRLKIILQNRPKNLDKIHYIVARKVDSKVPWATVEDVKRSTLNMITIQDYIRDGMILVETPPKADLYISIIGQYKMPDGSTVYSDASKLRISNKPKKKIKYRLTWGGGLFSSKPKPKDCKLYVISDAEETPVLKLVYRSDGHIPMKLLDPKTIVLHTIPESDTGFSAGQYMYEFPDSTWDRVKSQTELRLMLSDDDITEYEITPENIALLKVPQK
jgi:tetratricopeptide (TPR) repeat protein